VIDLARDPARDPRRPTATSPSRMQRLQRRPATDLFTWLRRPGLARGRPTWLPLGEPLVHGILRAGARRSADAAGRQGAGMDSKRLLQVELGKSV
jgi:hypothetical protein